jgi:hypothetical protein
VCESPDLKTHSALLDSHAYAPSIWAYPLALTRVNATTAQPSIPRRATTQRRLAVVRQRPAKGRSLPCLGEFSFWSYLVEERVRSLP